MTPIKDIPEETEGLDDVLRGLRAIDADAHLDEVARARIAAGLGRHLDAREVQRARRETGARGRLEAATRWLLPLAGAGLAAWLVLATNLRPPADGSPATPSTVMGNLDRLEVPAGARARARVGRADLTVVGPAQLEVTRIAASDMTLRLSSGTVVGDYDGHAGGRLRIETPRLIAQIVGTRFAIEATVAHARVSVAHGRVAVRDAAAPEGTPEIAVEAGQTWEVGRAQPMPTPAAVARLLAAEAGDEAARPAAPAAGAPLSANPPRAVSAATRPSAPARPNDAPLAQATSPLQPPPLAPAPPAQPGVAPLAPAEMYRRAEGAMLRQDAAAARHWLEELVARYPRDAAADGARFELAREAVAARATARASRWLDELIASGRDQSLVESAVFLKCRLASEGGEPAEARACLIRLRAQHPGSARDEEALAALIRLAQQQGACDDARTLRAEHQRLYPAIRLPEGDPARCPR